MARRATGRTQPHPEEHSGMETRVLRQIKGLFMSKKISEYKFKVRCRFCNKITAGMDHRLPIIHSPAEKEAIGTKWEIVATCPNCREDETPPLSSNTNPFNLDDLFNLFGITK
jgi:hypothetical protein